MLQMHHVGALRKRGQAVDHDMAVRLHPGRLGTESRCENHWRMAGLAQRIGQQLDHRIGAGKVGDMKIGYQYSQFAT